MAIFKCKMCGGSLEVIEGTTTCECEFCGTKQTLPSVNDETIQNLFNRANMLRMKSEFDKASEIYEKILQSNDSEAEAYWGLILCKYGIEYVEDPSTFKRIPTCHRASFDAVISDEDYKNAIKYASIDQKLLYEQQSKEIDEIQKGIITLAQKEDPYDVFICYKETDFSGKRTIDSVIANDIYHQLTQEGYKVFYAAITLEDKLGTEYEPYIFSALNSAKVMLAIGTNPDYFNAVWVKNEWSRFLKIMKKDRNRLLIPCYKDIDAYELPEEFAHLQAQDMNKIGFISDIVRGINKVVVKKQKIEVAHEVAVQQTQSNATSIAQIKRGNMSLEDKDWARADDFFEEALNLDPECADAYLGKMLAKAKYTDFDSWANAQIDKNSKCTYKRLIANIPQDTAHIEKISNDFAVGGYLDKDTIKKSYTFDFSYDSALECREAQMKDQMSEIKDMRLLARAKQYAKGELGQRIIDFEKNLNSTLSGRIKDEQERDRNSLNNLEVTYKKFIEETDKKNEIISLRAQNQREKEYNAAVLLKINALDIESYDEAKSALIMLNGYKDSNDLVLKCDEEINKLKVEAQLERDRQKALLENERALSVKRRKKVLAIVALIVCVCVAFAMVLKSVIIPRAKYNAAMALYNLEKYSEAMAAFKSVDYGDSTNKVDECFFLMQKDCLKSIEIGKIIKFGIYEQDGNESNGKEEIEWKVLSIEDRKALIISEYALDCLQYHSSLDKITWGKSELRNWLNDSFLNSAFSTRHQEMIASTNVLADNNPFFTSSNPGNATVDKVFLLSINELNKYLNYGNMRKCRATAYAKTQGVVSKIYNGNDNCLWWLRSPGQDNKYASSVYDDGSLNSHGYIVTYGTIGVRPAIWINLD